MIEPVFRNTDGTYYTYASGLPQLFDNALDAAMKIQSLYRNDPILSNKAEIGVFNEHLGSIVKAFLPFRNTKAAPRGNIRRALYRLEKLGPLSKRIVTIAHDSNNQDLELLHENSKQLINSVKMIKAALALLH